MQSLMAACTFSLLNLGYGLNVHTFDAEREGNVMIKLWIQQYDFVTIAQFHSVTNVSYALA